MKAEHYEVWHWPEGGAPFFTAHHEDPGPPCHAVQGLPEEPTGNGEAFTTEDPDEAKDVCFAWREADPSDQYRVVKVTTEVLEWCGCASE